MAYLDIDNLYKEQRILMFKECYAMEKIHGTSAHLSYTPPHPSEEYASVVSPSRLAFFDKQQVRRRYGKDSFMW